MTHPCSGCYGFDRENALEEYDLKQMAADIDSASRWIGDHLGAKPRTFAYPCGQTYVGRGAFNRSYVPLVAERFLAGRCFNHPVPGDPWHLDLAQTWSYDADRLPPKAQPTMPSEVHACGSRQQCQLHFHVAGYPK